MDSQLINAIVRDINIDDVPKGYGLRILVHGPQRQFIQVFQIPVSKLNERASEPEVKEGN